MKKALLILILSALSCLAGQVKIVPNGGGVKVGPTIKIQGSTAGGGPSAPPVYDSSTSAESTTMAGAVSNLNTAALSVGSNSNRLLIALIGIMSSDTTGVVVTPTWNSVSFTQLGTLQYDAGGERDGVDIWILKAPATGVQTFGASTTGTIDGAGITLVSLSNVDQTTPTGTKVNATGNSTAVTVTVSSAATSVVVDIVGWDSGSATMTAHTGRTQRSNMSSAVDSATSTYIPGIASTVMDWTVGNSFWVISAVSVNGI